MSRALREWLDHVEGDALLREPLRLRERLDAMDRMELLEEQIGDRQLTARVGHLRDALEAINQQLYGELRQAIRQGRNAFAPWIDTLESEPCGDSYDYRDELVSGVLAFDEPGDVEPLPPEMVFYQPTPARHVFDLIRRTRLDERDVLVDLGSGLGIVPLLVAIATGARTVGVERSTAYVAAARACARRLGLERASFECIDARRADCSQGTLFYLYTPFTGEVMRTVLATLRREAEQRPLRVATFGPCTHVLAAEPWLRAIGDTQAERLALFSAG